MRLKFYLAILILPYFFVHSAYSQEENNAIQYSLGSPYQTVYTHLAFLQEENYHPYIAAKAFNQAYLSEKESEELAIKLKQVLDGEGLYIEMEDVPKAPNYIDSATNKHRYVLVDKYPQIYLEKVGDRWLYAEKSANRIEALHDEVYPFGTDILLKLLPKIGNKVYFGLHLWQLAGILLLIILSMVIFYVFTFLFEKLIFQTLLSLGYKDVARKYIHPVAKPFSILVVVFFLIVFVRVLQLPPITAKYIQLVLNAAVPLFATLVFYHLVDVLMLYFEKLAGRTETTLDDQLVPLLRKTLKAFVVIVGVLFVLQNLNFNITALLAGVSIGGLAFALAAQDTIKNFFGSLMIFVDRPFQIGDWISSGSDIDGTVEEVGFRSTRIRTFRNSVTSVPNGKLADQTVDNHGMRRYRRFYTQIAITYDTPADLIELFVDGLKKIVESHPKTRKDFYEIHLNDLADYSINIMFYIFFAVPTWSEELKYRHEILLSIIRLAEKLNIRFAFPTQTLHMETFPEKQPMTPEYTDNMEELKVKMESYLNNREGSGGKG